MLALVIGNTHLHWAWFAGDKLQFAWDTPHLSPGLAEKLIHYQFDFGMCISEFQPPIAALSFEPTDNPELWIASVVPEQAALWRPYANARLITLDQIPIRGLYPSLGIDRALALFGAIETVGSPVLVIDAGTALTLTAADDLLHFAGGAILPGLGLQLECLAKETAVLAMAAETNVHDWMAAFLVHDLPPRWANNTPEAIQSGIVYTLLAGLRDFAADWVQKYGQSAIVLTGGDAVLLKQWLHSFSPKLAARAAIDPHLIFAGMRSL